MNIYYQL